MSLPGDVRVTRRYGELRVGKKTGVVKPFRVVIAAPGATMIPGLGAQVTTSWAKGVIRQRGVGVGHLPARASISREAVGRSKIIVRSWKSGDRIRPLGMSGSCKLQDVFVDAKVPRDARNLIPVFECRGEIIWIPGYRVARGWEVLPSQQTSLRIEVDKPRALT